MLAESRNPTLEKLREGLSAQNFSWFSPRREYVERYMAAHATESLSYSHVGATNRRPPEGWEWHAERICVGAGAARWATLNVDTPVWSMRAVTLWVGSVCVQRHGRAWSHGAACTPNLYARPHFSSQILSRVSAMHDTVRPPPATNFVSTWILQRSVVCIARADENRGRRIVQTKI